MKDVYKKIWRLAKPHYEKGRPMDIEHIRWIMKDALIVCEKENIDDSLLLPLVILHDVGYSRVAKENYFKMDVRKKAHMKEGAKIAKEILEKINYPKDKIKKICYYISVHDNWALEDHKIFKKDPILGIFNDLDFMWSVTLIGFKLVQKSLGKTPKEMLKWYKENNKHQLRPFCTKTTKDLNEKYIREREEETRR
jgi:hypothetical protein